MMSFFSQILNFLAQPFLALIPSYEWVEIAQGTRDTLLMVLWTMAGSVVLGLPLGVILFLTGPRQLLESPKFYKVASVVVNILRSLPFVILIVLIQPYVQYIMGTSLGVPGAIPSLILSAAPFYARLAETSLREVDKGLIEATLAMGATTFQLIWKTLLREARPSLIAGFTVTTIAVIGYTAMAGTVGSGGLGDIAIRYGYQMYDYRVMWVTVVFLVILVQAVQMIGDRVVLKVSHR